MENEQEDKQLMQEAYSRVLRDRMNMAINPMMNAAAGQSIFGGAQGAAQGSILQGIPGEYQQGRRIESYFDANRMVNVQVISADNGYIIVSRPDHPGTTQRVMVANTIEEVRDLITSQMVTNKMER